ncbi:MAG: hypothetical protein ABIH28_01905 [archaeon]
MTPVEIIALVLIIAGLVKMLVILLSPGKWMGFAKKVYAKPKLMSFVFLILAAIVFYYLMQELSIVQILAASAFTALLLGIGLAPHVKILLKKYEEQIKRGKILKENWLYALAWLALMLWGAKELFM